MQSSHCTWFKLTVRRRRHHVCESIQLNISLPCEPLSCLTASNLLSRGLDLSKDYLHKDSKHLHRHLLVEQTFVVSPFSISSSSSWKGCVKRLCLFMTSVAEHVGFKMWFTVIDFFQQTHTQTHGPLQPLQSTSLAADLKYLLFCFCSWQ